MVLSTLTPAAAQFATTFLAEVKASGLKKAALFFVEECGGLTIRLQGEDNGRSPKQFPYYGILARMGARYAIIEDEWGNGKKYTRPNVRF